MIGWAAFFKMQNDEMDRDREGIQTRAASRTQSR